MQTGHDHENKLAPIIGSAGQQIACVSTGAMAVDEHHSDRYRGPAALTSGHRVQSNLNGRHAWTRCYLLPLKFLSTGN